MNTSPKVPEANSRNPKGNNNLASKIFTCSVCQTNYDDHKKAPIILSCGHTLCKTCINNIPQKVCPYCKVPIQTNLIKNHELINLMHQAQTINLCPVHEKEASVICCHHKKLMCSVCILEKDRHHKNCELTHFEKMLPLVEDKWGSYQKYKQDFHNVNITFPEFVRSKKEELKETITEKFSDLLSNISLSISYKMVNAFKIIDSHFLAYETQMQISDVSKAVEEIDHLARQFSEKLCLVSGLKILQMDNPPSAGEPPNLKELHEDVNKNKKTLEEFCSRLLHNIQAYPFEVKFRKNRFSDLDKVKQRLSSSVSPGKKALNTQPTSTRTEYSMRASQLKFTNTNESTSTTNQLYDVVVSNMNTPNTHMKKTIPT